MVERRYVYPEVVSSSPAPVNFSLFKPKLFTIYSVSFTGGLLLYFFVNKRVYVNGGGLDTLPEEQTKDGFNKTNGEVTKNGEKEKR